MKANKLIITTVLVAIIGLANAQTPTSVTFTKTQQAQIVKILGQDAGAVFSNGSLIITSPTKVSQIKSSPTSLTGFTNFKGPSAAEWVAAKKEWWVVKSAGDVLQSKLGASRFAELSKILSTQGLVIK